MSNLDAIDRSASIFCLGLVALLMIVAPLFGVGEDRFHVTLNAKTTQATIHRYSVPLPVGGEASISSGFEAASVAQPTHRPSTGRAASIDAKGARPAATAVVANIAAALPAFGGGRPAAAATFVCVDFVCVNRSTAVRNLFDYSPAAIAKLPIHTSFASCVQHCVATKASAGVTPGRSRRRRWRARRPPASPRPQAPPPPPPPPQPPLPLPPRLWQSSRPRSRSASLSASLRASLRAWCTWATAAWTTLSLVGSLCATIGRASRAPPRRPSTLLPLPSG